MGWYCWSPRCAYSALGRSSRNLAADHSLDAQLLSMPHGACVILAAVSMAFGGMELTSLIYRPMDSSQSPSGGRRLIEVYDSIGQYVETSYWKRTPSISFNLISDTMSAPAISVVEFERGRPLHPDGTLIGTQHYGRG